MKPNLFLTLACLCCLAGFAMAQPATLPEEEAGKAIMKSMFRPFWSGQSINLAVVQALGDPDVRTAWEISDEQLQQCEEYLRNRLSQSDEVNKIRVQQEDQMSTIAVAGDMPSEGWEAAPEAIKKLQDIAERASVFIMEATVEALEEYLTPAQWQKIRESQLANMDEMPIISPDMFEALNLTDAQRQEKAKIKKELEPEFEAVLDEFIKGMTALQNETANNPENDPALYKKRQMEVMSKGKTFSTKFKTQMFDVLTDAQWQRLQNLIDNPPEHAKIFRAKLKEQNGESEEPVQAAENPEKEVWQPGPNSWKPGDAIPEGYRIERNERSRFPRGETLTEPQS